MILIMTLARCGVHILRALLGIGFFALLVVQTLAALEWDSNGAANAFEEARQKHNQVSQTTNPTINNYLECAKAYRKVYVRDPHYKSAGEAIYSEGIIYQEMGNRYSNREYYLLATKRFNLLVKDYSGNPNCPDALLRMAAIYSKDLKDESSAQDAYARLNTRYKYAITPIQKTHKDVSSNTSSLKENNHPDNANRGETPAISSVQNIRYWSSSDQTRIIIDMDLDAEYQAERLTKPDRIYFDISNATASRDLQNRTIAVKDEHLKQIRIRQNGRDAVRVVFDVSAASAYTVSELHKPFRIIINLQHPIKAPPTEQISGTSLKEDVHSNVAIQPALPDSRKLPNASISLAPTETKKAVNPISISEPKRQQTAILDSGAIVNANKQYKPALTSIPVNDDNKSPTSAPKQVDIKAAEPVAVPNPKPFVASYKISGIKVPLPPRVSTEKERRVPLNNTTASAASSSAQIPTNQQDSANKIASRATEISEENQKATPSVQMADLKIQLPHKVVTQNTFIQPESPKTAPITRPTDSVSQNSVQISTDIGLKLTPSTASEIASPPKSISKTSSGDRTLTRMLGLKVGRIVIDPGHGGHDLGTVGPEGLLEKNFVLTIARDLQKQLQDRLGAQVVLTRNDDRFISLEERTAIANQHRADLFISIHANSSRMRSTSGVETYYLDFANTEAEKEVAARENAIAENNVRDLEDLIKKIAQAEKSAESRELASIVQKRLYTESRKFSPKTNNRGVRRAPFIVLIGANMPSVLAEVAFLSNPKDEKLLKKKTNRELLVNALFSGIESYMKTLGSAIAHNQSASSK
jgi:N-acetylmuramoyl-L-alanine amidase